MTGLQSLGRDLPRAVQPSRSAGQSQINSMPMVGCRSGNAQRRFLEDHLIATPTPAAFALSWTP
jgi:hypothetical protein